jgi:cytochrome c-type biogenesis protein CcmH
MRRAGRRLAATLAVVLAFAGPASAVQPDEIHPDPRLEARARALSAELRCLVCQNQSIDDSDAPLARDLRLVVRDRLKAGDTDPEIRHYVVRRYGEFVLLRPTLGLHTLILWVGPLLIVVAGATGLALARRRRRAPRADALTPDEEAELRRVIEGRS